MMNDLSPDELQKDLTPYIDEDGRLTLRSQDIYLIREDGTQATLINYEDYTGQNARLIEWCYSESDHHFFFSPQKSIDRLQPMNLMGPILTKVIPWNLDNACYPENVDPCELKPGYLLDLRVLQLNRLRAPLNANPPLLEKKDTPIRKLTRDPDRQVNSNIPPCSTHQLKEPVPENLYIVSYLNPLQVKDTNDFYPYHIHYLGAEDINQLPVLDFEKGADIDLDELQQTITELKNQVHSHTFVDISDLISHLGKIKNESNTLTAQSLARYYRNAGVQAGALNPKDVQTDSRFVGTVCMVANLQSFL
ncbi:hypothetical protein [Vibrio spartinae]|nr:hypothetical protein [Vibrio spartinae]